MKHTPTPWKAKLNGGDFYDIYQTGEPEIVCIASVWTSNGRSGDANAEFIVSACNAHEMLLAAVKAIRDIKTADCVEYVKQADTIACEALAQWEAQQ